MCRQGNLSSRHSDGTRLSVTHSRHGRGALVLVRWKLRQAGEFSKINCGLHAAVSQLRCPPLSRNCSSRFRTPGRLRFSTSIGVSFKPIESRVKPHLGFVLPPGLLPEATGSPKLFPGILLALPRLRLRKAIESGGRPWVLPGPRRSRGNLDRAPVSPTHRKRARRYPDLDRARFEPRHIGSHEDHMVFGRYADANPRPEFRLSIAPVFPFLPARASAFLENLVGAWGDRPVNFGLLFFRSEGTIRTFRSRLDGYGSCLLFMLLPPQQRYPYVRLSRPTQAMTGVTRSCDAAHKEVRLDLSSTQQTMEWLMDRLNSGTGPAERV